MDADFWRQRWSENLIGFHQQAVNRHLQRYWGRLSLARGAPVFVPLCGKSLDLLWLAERSPVVGVELSEIAVRDFFADNGMLPASAEEGPYKVFAAAQVRLLCGDIFDLKPAQLSTVKGVYDRAALIALPPAMRARYAELLTRLLPAGTAMLLVTMDYEQSRMQGPPFAVTADEVQRLFSPAWYIEALETVDILAEESKFRDRGLEHLTEQIYLLKKQ